ncbi:hypothetical protein QEN19_002517 [Hanseniaspora menglaensis]
MAGSHSHRSSFKKNHKSFKSKHSSKSALKKVTKGKVETSTSHNNNNKPMLNKMQRKNQSRQYRDTKIQSTTLKKKLFEGSNGVQKIVTIIPLTKDINPCDILSQLLVNGIDSNDFDSSNLQLTVPSVNTVKINKFKKSIKFVIPDMKNILDVMDVCKVSDVIVFGLSSMEEVDASYGEQILRAIELQGISSYIGVISNLSAINMKEKFQLDIKQSLESYFKHFFPLEKQLYNLEKKNESSNCLRILCEKLPSKVSWRDNRGYLVVNDLNNLSFIPETNELILQGHCRGVGFHADGLVHLPGLGDFQINKLEQLSAHDHSNTLHEYNFTENRESLDDFNEDEVEMEDEELNKEHSTKFKYDSLTTARFDDGGFLPGDANTSNNIPEVRMPKGTSSYQARWYLNDVIDEDEESASEFEDEKQGEEMEEDMLIDIQQKGENYDYEEADDDEDFEDFTAEEEERQLMEYRNLEKQDKEFPDEVELHPLEQAREVLNKYRGLKNLYNCSWDIDEFDDECPDEWFNILRISNFKNTRKKVIKDFKNTTTVKEGDYFKIHINLKENGSLVFEKLKSLQNTVLSVFSLLPHEHKQTVANFSIQRWEEYEAPIPSKEPMIVQYGIRRYEIEPMFSGATVTPNNVHKFDRFLHHNSLSVATCIAPVDFTQSPAIFFKMNSETGNPDLNGIEFLGHGSFISSDHTRVLAKRIVLTGSPFKFHKNVVTIRYMFFNSEDVEWFKSIPLFTNSGRSGFIKESLGTHGYFKGTFDTQLSAQDIIGMSLYKRMWPEISKPWSPL